MNTDDENYQALQKIFLEALELRSPEEREAYLGSACAGDASRREAIDALLKEYEEGSGSVSSDDANTPETRDSAMFVPGKVLADRYRIVTLLGKGGMGEVYRADDLKLEQPVALKFLPAALAQDQLVPPRASERGPCVVPRRRLRCALLERRKVRERQRRAVADDCPRASRRRRTPTRRVAARVELARLGQNLPLPRRG